MVRYVTFLARIPYFFWAFDSTPTFRLSLNDLAQRGNVKEHFSTVDAVQEAQDRFRFGFPKNEFRMNKERR